MCIHKMEYDIQNIFRKMLNAVGYSHNKGIFKVQNYTLKLNFVKMNKVLE